MRLKIEANGTYRKSQQAKDELKKYGKETKLILQFLAKQFDFISPNFLIIRPLYSQHGIRGNYGRAWHNRRHWTYGRVGFISLNVPKLRLLPPRVTFHVVFHEACHVAEGMKHGKGSHGPNFKRMIESIVHYKPKHYDLIPDEQDQVMWSWQLLNELKGES